MMGIGMDSYGQVVLDSKVPGIHKLDVRDYVLRRPKHILKCDDETRKRITEWYIHKRTEDYANGTRKDTKSH